MIHTQASPTGDGAILHDAAISGIDEHWFDADWWARQQRAQPQAGGRGGIVFVSTPVGDAALRHYRRGGLVGRWNADRYLWTGAGRNRAFVEFHLLKGPVADDHTLYSSHTTWVDKAAFEAWTRSEEFRRAHARADNKTGESLYLGHPKFEGFDVILSERKSSAAA